MRSLKLREIRRAAVEGAGDGVAVDEEGDVHLRDEAREWREHIGQQSHPERPMHLERMCNTAAAVACGDGARW